MKVKIATAFNIHIATLIFIFINGLFVFKYSVRTTNHSYLVFSLYSFTVVSLFYLYNKFKIFLSEKHFKLLSYTLLVTLIVLITILLIFIDPMSVRVDRWSALTYFIDAFRNNIYPYGVHTHVSDTNFPSPFPIWYVINLPFYLLGDVGVGLIFFLLILFLTVVKIFRSYKLSFILLFLLAISPAYWWEVGVRSDSLNNAMFVFITLVIVNRYNITLSNNYLFSILICVIIACTRLSAIIPVCMYLFQPYIKLPLLRKVLFPILIAICCIAIFSPFIFWDTTSWIFFKRNPFMSQTGLGNPLVLILSGTIGIFLSLQWKSFKEFTFYTGIALFIFFLLSETYLAWINNNVNIFENSKIDISYFSLCLPYIIFVLASKELVENNTYPT